MKPALGRGLGSLIPNAPRPTLTEQVIPSARREILEVPVGDIRENPHQPRRVFPEAELRELADSIREHGLMQPLIVTRRETGYELIAGERRLRACRLIGLETVPVIVREANEQQKLELALIENIQRQDLNPVDEAIAYRALIDEFGLSQEEVGARVGLSRPSIANAVRLLELPSDMLDAVRDGSVSRSQGRTLLAEVDPVRRRELYTAMRATGMTVSEMAARVAASPLARKNKRSTQGKSPNVLAHEARLREALGTRVDIQEAGGKGKIAISFFSPEEFREILTRLLG